MNPQCPINFWASQVNGITDDMVCDAPTFDTALAVFLEFVGDMVPAAAGEVRTPIRSITQGRHCGEVMLLHENLLELWLGGRSFTKRVTPGGAFF